jgi:hypothetical protein
MNTVEGLFSDTNDPNTIHLNMGAKIGLRALFEK